MLNINIRYIPIDTDPLPEVYGFLRPYTGISLDVYKKYHYTVKLNGNVICFEHPSKLFTSSYVIHAELTGLNSTTFIRRPMSENVNLYAIAERIVQLRLARIVRDFK